MHTHLYKDTALAHNWEHYKNDFQTPVNVAKYMVKMIPEGITTVLEPTPGIGNISRELIRAGYSVTAPTDFFLLNSDVRYDCIVMNPPFSSKFVCLDNAPGEVQHAGMKMGYWFLTECMKRSDNIIALMPWFTISDSDLRLRMVVDFGLKGVTALPRKTFNYARIQTCILDLERGYTGSAYFRTLPYKDPAFIGLFDGKTL